MSDLERDRRGGLGHEGRDPPHRAPPVSEASTLGLSAAALLAFFAVSMGAGMFTPVLGYAVLASVAIAGVGMLVKAASDSAEPRRAAVPSGDGGPPDAAPSPVSKERELLAVLRDSDGTTPIEAAMETSLTVREADEMLSELAGGGHLAVESRGGSLFYALPKREDREISS